MAIQLTHHTDDKFVEVGISGKLSATDYEQFGPRFEHLIATYGPLRVMLVLDDFEGWTFSGLWEDVKFDMKHFNDFELLAIVGEKVWHAGMAAFCAPFTTAIVRYFEDVSAAREWLTHGATAPAPQDMPSEVTDG